MHFNTVNYNIPHPPIYSIEVFPGSETEENDTYWPSKLEPISEGEEYPPIISNASKEIL